MILAKSEKLVSGSKHWFNEDWLELGKNNAAINNGSTTLTKRRKGRHEKKVKKASNRRPIPEPITEEDFEKPSLYVAFAGYFCQVMLVVVGYIREFFFGHGPVGGKAFKERHREGYTPLYNSFESFYTRNFFRRVKDTFCRPMGSVPGAEIEIIGRTSDDHFWTLKMDETERKRCVNLASYNYLGYAESDGPCTEAAIKSVKYSGLSSCSSPKEMGNTEIQHELEKTVTEFMGTEDAITFGMGFATNALNLPTLLSKNCLVLSDEKNHASLILGLRLSGATVMVFKHNSPENLEKILRKALIHGHPKTRRAWKKVLIVVEGVYSMEGTVVRLPEIVAIKKKYGAYLYLDEAHSIGAMGPNGRGIVDYYGVNPRDVDILMGTFTKSFGAAGGYIAGSSELISFLRRRSHAATYATGMSAPVAQQVITSMREIMYGDGVERIRRLARNSRYFRHRLMRMGCIAYGHPDSPVVPFMVFFASKLRYVCNRLHDMGVAVVGVGFPATKLNEERVRVCISAGHTKEMLDAALEAIEEVADEAGLKYSRKKYDDEKEIEY